MLQCEQPSQNPMLIMLHPDTCSGIKEVAIQLNNSKKFLADFLYSNPGFSRTLCTSLCPLLRGGQEPGLHEE